MSDDKGRVLEFRISLAGIQPEIWRVIEVPYSYSFWDLHVAIQDAMGWLDYHLHSFIIGDSSAGGITRIGVPDGSMDDELFAGREVPIARYFAKPGDVVGYEYDFGDSWYHQIKLAAILPRDPELMYPRCAGGERACPPEDCGGVPGYYDLLEALADPKHREHRNMIAWLKDHAKNYFPYDPDAFDPSAVKFWDPEVRWKMAFEDE